MLNIVEIIKYPPYGLSPPPLFPPPPYRPLNEILKNLASVQKNMY